METQLAQLQLENKKLKEELADLRFLTEDFEGAMAAVAEAAAGAVKETYFQRGFDAGREEFEIDLQLHEDTAKEIEKLCNFLGGNFDSEEDVKKILKDHYSEEFIKTNTERWREVGIDFEEKEEYVPTGSKVDMEQFQKLMESGMVP